jgi:hypothetical protein
MPSGYSATLPDDTLVDVAVLSRDVASTPTTFGVSRGGLTFTPTKEMRNVEFDGKRSPVAGLDRITAHGATISGTFIQFGTAQLTNLEPSSSIATATSTAGTTHTLTPQPASTLIAEGDLIANLTLTYQRLGGGTVKVIFPFAICTEYELSGEDNSEAEISATFEARLGATAAATSTDTAPYSIVVFDAA